MNERNIVDAVNEIGVKMGSIGLPDVTECKCRYKIIGDERQKHYLFKFDDGTILDVHYKYYSKEWLLFTYNFFTSDLIKDFKEIVEFAGEQ